MSTFRSHTHSVYASQWHPTHSSMFLSVSGDKTARIWDSGDSVRPAVSINAHPMEVLSCSWSPTESTTFYTGSVDKTIRVWDIRAVRAPICALEGHEFAVRKIRASPTQPGVLASASYDMSVIVWDIHNAVKKFAAATLTPSLGQLRDLQKINAEAHASTTLGRYNHHSEFVVGLAWSPTSPDTILSCSWDNTVQLWRV